MGRGRRRRATRDVLRVRVSVYAPARLRAVVGPSAATIDVVRVFETRGCATALIRTTVRQVSMPAFGLQDLPRQGAEDELQGCTCAGPANQTPVSKPGTRCDVARGWDNLASGSRRGP